MSFSNYMNMEKITLDIAEKHFQLMTEDNHGSYGFIDEKSFLNNIENGFVVITQMNCFIE